MRSRFSASRSMVDEGHVDVPSAVPQPLTSANALSNCTSGGFQRRPGPGESGDLVDISISTVGMNNHREDSMCSSSIPQLDRFEFW